MKDTIDNPFKNADMIRHKSSNSNSKGPAHSGKYMSTILEAIPVLLMILLIPLMASELNMTGLYLAIILVSLLIKYERGDLMLLLSGLIISTLFFEILIFFKIIQFTTASLINLPIWFPLIWAHGFILIKRCTKILEQ